MREPAFECAHGCGSQWMRDVYASVTVHNFVYDFCCELQSINSDMNIAREPRNNRCAAINGCRRRCIWNIFCRSAYMVDWWMYLYHNLIYFFGVRTSGLSWSDEQQRKGSAQLSTRIQYFIDFHFDAAGTMVWLPVGDFCISRNGFSCSAFAIDGYPY